MKKLFSIMSNLQTHYDFKLDFQKVGQYIGGKWLIHSTKQCRDDQLQSLELPCRISYIDTKMVTNRFKTSWSFCLMMPLDADVVSILWLLKFCLLASFRDHFAYVSSQWQMALHCNAVSYWQGAYTKSMA